MTVNCYDDEGRYVQSLDVDLLQAELEEAREIMGEAIVTWGDDKQRDLARVMKRMATWCVEHP